MKIYLSILATLAVIMLGALLYIDLEERSERIEAHKEQAAQADALAREQAISDRHERLARICDDVERQVKLLMNAVQVGRITQAQADQISKEYTDSRADAEAQLQVVPLDMSKPMPSLKYIEDELKLGVLVRD